MPTPLPSFLDRLIAKADGASQDAPDEVVKVLYKNYKPEVLGWVKGASWTRRRVPLSQIAMDRRPGGRNMAKVDDMARRIRNGERLGPVVLVDGQRDGRYRIADGFHRTLAAKWAGRTYADAWIAHNAVGFDGPAMHAAKLNVAPGEKAAKEGKSRQPQKCSWCPSPATKSLLWAEGMAYIPTCDAHEHKTHDHIVQTNHDEISAVHTIKSQADGPDDISPIDRGKPIPQGNVPGVRYPTTTLKINGLNGESQLDVHHAKDARSRMLGFTALPDEGYDQGHLLMEWPADAQATIHNVGVRQPLAVHFFDAKGRHVHSAQMEAHQRTPITCPVPHRYALEMHPDQADELGLGPGSSISMADEKEQVNNDPLYIDGSPDPNGESDLPRFRGRPW